MGPESVLVALRQARVVPVVTIEDPDAAVPLAQALVAGGIPCAEITLRTPAAIDAIREIAGALPDFAVGAGTVLSAADAELAAAAGARFAVSPGLDEEVVTAARAVGMLPLPGVATATEIQRALRIGVADLKLFPVTPLGGSRLIAQLAAPFPGVRFVPSGGIDLAALPDYLELAAVLAVGGSWMVRPAWIAARDFAAVERAAAETSAAVRGVAA